VPDRYDAARRKAIAVVEALRAGIPTRVSTRELPDLRVALTNTIRKDLEQFAQGDRPQGRLAWGAYGQGKTHMLTTIEHVALDLGFAVSRVSLSREVSCHHLFNFYGRVAAALRTPDSKVLGLERSLNRKTGQNLLASAIAQPGRYLHPLPALVLEDYFYGSGEDQEMLYGDLMGTRLTSPELKRIHRNSRGEALPKFETNFRATQHGSAYFGMMADAIQLCGYKGWVLLLDEVELIGRLGKVSRLQAYRNLNWLLQWPKRRWDGNVEQELFYQAPYPIYTVGVVASSLRNDVWFSGTSTPSAKNDRAQIPDLAAEKFGPEASQEMKHFFETAISSRCPTIKPLETKDLLSFLEHLVKLHGTAYAWSAELDLQALVRAIGSQPIRTYIRATLEALDIGYVYHESLTPEVTELMEASLQEQEDFFVVDQEEA
jgi:hypothetical protein